MKAYFRPFLLSLSITFAAFPQGYSFSSVADNARFTIALGQAIAPNGDVLFGGLPRTGSGGAYIFKDGTVTLLPPFPPNVQTNSSIPSINSGKTIVASFVANDLSGGIFKFEGAQLTPIYTVPPLYLASPRPRINERGDVAFSIGTVQNSKVILVSGSQVTTLAELSGNLAGTQFLSDADINNRGDVAFVAGGGDTSKGGLFVYSNGALKRSAPEAAFTVGIVDLSNTPSINDQGVVVFKSLDASVGEVLRIYYPDGRSEVFAAKGRSIDGLPIETLERPAINNQNGVAFVAVHASQTSINRGIYAQKDGVVSKVIRVGDPLFGSTVVDILMPQGEYLADNGSILFNYFLANRTGGVALAIPAVQSARPPVLSANSILNAASFVLPGQAGHAISPGAAVSIFGSQFVERLTVASGSPLPTSLGGLSVTINGTPAPLFFAAPGQINAQLPYSVTGGTAEVRVKTAGGESTPQILQLTTASPALYTANQQGSGQAIAIYASTGSLVAPASFAAGARPARAGDVIVLYGNGMGGVNPPIAAGSNSCNPDGRCASDYSNLVLRRVVSAPVIQIGGVTLPPENIAFAGLAPEFAGLYQINFTMPSGVAAGAAVPIVIRQGSNASRSDVTIAVE